MSNSMGFRNSGKLNLSGKQMEYILAGALLLIIVVAVVFAVGPLRCGGGGIDNSGENRVKCLKCNAEWTITQKEAANFNRETEMGGATVGRYCEKCKTDNAVFLMNRCFKCKKYYLSKRITDPEAFIKGGKKEICPFCGTDQVKWYREHRRK